MDRDNPSSMRRNLLAGFAVFAGLAGWASAAGAGLFSATGPVIAIIADDLFVGEAEGHLDGSGTFRIQSRTRPGLNCRGQFTHSAEFGNAGRMQCSDGATGTFQFQRLTILRGYGTGSVSREIDELHLRAQLGRIRALPDATAGQNAQAERKRPAAAGCGTVDPGESSDGGPGGRRP